MERKPPLSPVSQTSQNRSREHSFRRARGIFQDGDSKALVSAEGSRKRRIGKYIMFRDIKVIVHLNKDQFISGMGTKDIVE